MKDVGGGAGELGDGGLLGEVDNGKRLRCHHWQPCYYTVLHLLITRDLSSTWGERAQLKACLYLLKNLPNAQEASYFNL